MKNNICYLYVVLSVLLSACTKDINSPIKHFDEKSAVKIQPTKIVKLEEFGILRPFNFLQIDDSMFVIQDLKNEKIFNLINLSSKKVISGINKGQGPGEVLAPSSLLFRDNKILVWDAMQKKMNEIVLASDTTLIIEEAYRIDTENIILFFVHQLDSTLVATSQFDDYWLVEITKNGEIISTINYPVWQETKGLQLTALSALFRAARMANSPDKKRMVVAIGTHGFISFLNRTDFGLKEYKQIKYHPPKFKVTDRGSASYHRDNVGGFSAVDCDDNFVYALYSGKTFNNNPMLSSHCEHLLVYDWDGNPVKRYVLDVPIFNTMSYDKENNCIYGLAENPEGVLIVYQL